MWSDAQISEAFGKFQQDNPWNDWVTKYLEVLERVGGRASGWLSTAPAQQFLWTCRGIATLGPGDSINVSKAWTHEELVARIAALPERSWPADPEERGKELQAEFHWLLGTMTAQKLSQVRPNLKLQRLILALLPGELHVAFTWKRNQTVSELLLPPEQQELDHIVRMVLARARLREALGEEHDERDHVWRGMFAWWLQENPEFFEGKLSKGGGATGGEIVSPKKLSLLSYERQRKGISAVRGQLDCFRELLQLAGAVDGASSTDLVEELKAQDRYASLSLRSGKAAIFQMRSLGLLDLRGDLLFPTSAALEFLKGGEPDIVVERLLERVFGFAQLLKGLEAEPSGLPRGQLNSLLQAHYPRWTTGMAPNQIVTWSSSAGLIEQAEGRPEFQLSDYGKNWAARLPADLPRAPSPPPQGEHGEQPGSVEDGQPGEETTVVPPTFSALLHELKTDPEASRFVFDDRDVRALHAAWHANARKRFVLLSGLSGTGKTQLARQYARLYCKLSGLDPNQHRAVVPVSPDWRDPTGLLGYLNPLHDSPTFQPEPALQLVLQAHAHRTKPYFLILDEMNLARVERYFAPFLSAMETGDDLVLHANEESVNEVPPRISWPENLFIAGTVNMDETTHAFSDKVLDRAFTLEFWKVDLETFFSRRPTTLSASDADRVQTLLVAINHDLEKVRRHFGYRSAGEVMAFVETTASFDESSDVVTEALDQAVFAKVLPRLRGEETPVLSDALKAVGTRCGEHKLVRCAAKLEEMSQRLEATGITRFWA